MGSREGNTQELVGEIQQIQAKMDVLIPLHPSTSKDIQNLIIKL
jgi:hypothetical protein